MFSITTGEPAVMEVLTPKRIKDREGRRAQEL
jgi:hypothetical protein